MASKDVLKLAGRQLAFCSPGPRAVQRLGSQRLAVRAQQQPLGNGIAGAPPRTPTPPVTNIFTGMERTITNTFNGQNPGQRIDWKEVEGAWVLYPPNNRPPEAVVHFLGGAFVGAAPQLSYRLFLEALSNRNVLVIATPYSINFDHLRIADEAQFKFDRALRALGPEASMLPVYGLGHSLGCAIHMLICTRYAVKRSGNAFLSYNNRNAADVIPLLAPVIAPSARTLGPLLNQIAASPVRSTVEATLETLRGMSPSVIRQVAPVIEQLAPIYLDLAQGRMEFSPTPEEARHLMQTYYSVPRNLLLRFKDDNIDESNSLATILQNAPEVNEVLDLSVRTLPGDHLRPMQQAFVDLPPEIARLANQAVYTGGDVVGRLASLATQLGVTQATPPLYDLSRGITGMSSSLGGEVGGPVTDSMQNLSDEVAAWIGTGAAVISGSRALPVSSVYAARPQFGARSNPDFPTSF